METKKNMFKKLLLACMAFVLALAMALPVSAASGWSFSYSGTNTKPGDNATKLVKKIKKYKKDTNNSCLGAYQEITYKVGKITVVTYKKKKNSPEYLNSVTVTGGTTKIAGVKVGDTLSKVKKAENKKFKDAKANDRAKTFTKGKTKVKIKISSKTKKVTEIVLCK